MALTTEEIVFRYYLWYCGASDEELSRMCYITIEAVSMWRRKHNLLANPQAGKALEIREFLYHQGLSDMEIAILLKCDNSAIRKWRYKHNLVSTVSNRPKRTREEIMYARIKTKLEVLDVDSREISGGTVED